MDIKESVRYRVGTETFLRQTIAAKLEDFYEKTGLSIQSVNVELADVTSRDDIQPHFILISVNLDVRL